MGGVIAGVRAEGGEHPSVVVPDGGEVQLHGDVVLGVGTGQGGEDEGLVRLDLLLGEGVPSIFLAKIALTSASLLKTATELTKAWSLALQPIETKNSRRLISAETTSLALAMSILAEAASFSM